MEKLYQFTFNPTMPQEKFTLTWHTYSDHLRNMMKELMINDEFADVTIVTEDKKHIKAHKNILSACSPVFKDILQQEMSSNVIYLRGIQFSELESIMQFIYYGEATFFEQRMDEFLNVAQSLEIKELFKADILTETDEPNETTGSNFTEENVTESESNYPNVDEVENTQNSSFDNQKNFQRKRRKTITPIDNKFKCDQCDKEFGQSFNLHEHIKSKHEGVKYSCDQCDYQAKLLGNLKRHIESKHEGVRYSCDQCKYKATTKGSLKIHKTSQHKI